MAKIIAPFKISGTLDDINFSVTADGNNYARMKGKTGVTSEEFNNNPIFDRIRDHGKEWGYCAKKAVSFRQMAVQLYKKAKDGSFAGRSNKILLEILEEDSVNPKGSRTFEEGIKSEYIPEILIGFEGNKNRPLDKVLKTAYQYNEGENTLTLSGFDPEKHLQWPEEEATHVQLQMAVADWDATTETFETNYSEEITLEKNQKTDILLKTDTLEGKNWKIVYLYIGFALQQRRKFKILHRKNNTATIINCHKT
ncbi:hypothetical protein FLJC2902T_29870 [Flavobacterium limnosediminis JC2902]|uniref:Uncharacterized protein n=1 Tax=Flavobacterium limnosediminis JC2902 TaxID=1341181 RepID=V6SHP3_9FLAO|nr:hypothetical protein [Flavobacterium limnosediminis]ESU25974.1 hypothetical protein FLJC2902T_29870 [Flavobacterium limnosediminis JC2902]